MRFFAPRNHSVKVYGEGEWEDEGGEAMGEPGRVRGQEIATKKEGDTSGFWDPSNQNQSRTSISSTSINTPFT